MKVKFERMVRHVLVFSMILLGVSGNFSSTAVAASVTLTDSGGWFESTYVEWSTVSGAESYNVYVKSASAGDSSYTQLDNELIRQYSSYWRADAVGLESGDYVMKVTAILSDGSTVSAATGRLTATANDRSGFAFSGESEYGTASGAYNDDGTLKDGAEVVYVTSDTAQTVTLDVVVSSSGKVQTATGIGEILTLRQKGYDTTPLAIRFIGQVTDSDMSGELNSNGYLQVKGKSSYKEMNMTIEGIGEDTTAYGWGILIRNCANVEVRNFGIMLFPDDGISLDTDNCNIWIHNNDIFYGTAGSDSDQAKGDGSADVKSGSTYVTLAYNHFWDSGKCSLCGMSDTDEFYVTYHHNWYDHSDSRHPRIRVASVHIYNNYFDGNAKYGVGTTKGSSAFVEANYFRNCKNPMMSSLQGTDALGDGTFSGENGGMIKAFNNIIEGASSLIYANSDLGTTSADSTSFDAYLASSRTETVSSSYQTVAGGTTYNNFDTSMDIGVSASDIDDVDDVEQIVTTSAGRMNQGDFVWEFDDSVDDTSYSVNTELMSAITNYTTGLVAVGGNSTEDSSEDSIEDSSEDSDDDSSDIPSDSDSMVHNFTTDGLDSDFFTIVGNLSTSKGTVTYNGLTLTQCLKIESSTSISFTTTDDSTLNLIFNSEDGTKIKIDGTSYEMTDGIVSVTLDAGDHTITKANVTNLYYMELYY